jgi:hypothetical protein
MKGNRAGILRVMFASGALLSAGCDVGHADYAVDLHVDTTVTSTDNRPIVGAKITLVENGRAVSQWPSLCSSDSLGRCSGHESFRFGRNYYQWRGRQSGMSLALSVAAPSYDTEVIPLDSLTREEISGLRPITRKISLRRSR